ncbi:hypothetical protein LUZ61_000874 [Rhynchospora tenuis]|uniref:RRM domain-containing protein n=1 Tax=Rhynchospora tenuis TaxID=198213 RepID=A0AAD5ZGC3_9POAL|nr:hypothetical protein LUZ61_000874 [Rhynchospora tenuis]
MEIRTVLVKNVSDLAREREIREFFSFSGEIEHIDLKSDESGTRRVAYVTFKDPSALEIALRLSGATIVDQIVDISPVENYIYIPVTSQQVIVHEESEIGQETSSDAAVNSPPQTEAKAGLSPGRVYVSKAQDVVQTVIQKGSALGQDAVNRAKAFNEKHRLRASASEKVSSFDQRIGLSQKINIGISVVNEKVRSVDQRLHVSDKTIAAITVAERKLSDTGTAVKTNRYVTASTSWLNGAFSKVARAGHVAGTRTREKFQVAMSNLTAKDPTVVA